MGHAGGDFLVGVEAETDFTVGNLGMEQQMPGGVHHGGDARFVVGPEEGFAAGGDEVVSENGVEERSVFEGEGLAGIVGQNDGLAGVGAVDERGGGAREVGGGVDMSTPSHDGNGLGDCGGNGCEYVAMGGERDLCGTEGGEFGGEQAEEIPLARGGGRGGRVRIAAGVDLDVAEKAGEEVGGVDGHGKGGEGRKKGAAEAGRAQ